MLAKKLKAGDTIGIVTPSKPIGEERKTSVQAGVEFLQSLGLKVKYGRNAFNTDKYGVSGGTPEQRANDINEFFADPEVQAIWCVQGGNTANQILDLLDYDLIKKNPKVFLGKSDIDLLHLVINKMTGLITFHSPDIKIGGKSKEMDYEYSQQWFINRIMKGRIGDIEKATEWKTIRNGKGSGRLIGCNITSILKLAGTKYFPKFNDSVIFLESFTSDIETTIYKLTQLKQLGVFAKVKAVVIGYIFRFQDEEYLKKDPRMNVNGDKVNYEDIVLDVIRDYDFPILKINEFGHYYPNAIIPIGSEVAVDSDKQEIRIVSEILK